MQLKKIFSITISTLLFFAACSGNDKWVRDISDMPNDWIKKQQESLNINLELLNKDPKDVTAQGMVGFYYYVLGEYRRAEGAYKSALELDPNDFRSLSNLSKLYEEVGQFNDAAAYVKRLYDTNRDNARVAQDTVRILLKSNDPDAAQQALDSFANLKQKEEGAIINQLYIDIQEYRKKQK